MGPTVTRLVKDPLAVKLLDNQLYISSESGIFKCFHKLVEWILWYIQHILFREIKLFLFVLQKNNFSNFEINLAWQPTPSSYKTEVYKFGETQPLVCSCIFHRTSLISISLAHKKTTMEVKSQFSYMQMELQWNKVKIMVLHLLGMYHCQPFFLILQLFQTFY